MNITADRKKMYGYINTFLIVTFPILRVYAGGFSSFNLAEILMFLFMIIYAIRFGIREIFTISRFQSVLFVVLLFEIGISLFDWAWVEEYHAAGVALRICKWLFYYAIMLYQMKLFDLKAGIKLFKLSGFLICFFMWVQIICYRLFHIMLTMKIPFLKINAWQQEYLQFDYNGVNIYRPYSLFQEPAHIVYYVSFILCMVLFIEQNNKYRYLWAFFFSISLAASTSTTAFIFLGVVWGGVILGAFKSRKVKNYYLLVLLLICLIAGTVVLLRTSYAQYVLDKLINGTSRTRSFLNYFSMLPGAGKAVGIGMGNEAYFFLHNLGTQLGFVNGFGYLLLATGSIGCFVYVLQLFYYIIKSKFETNIFIVLYVLLLSIDVVFRDIYFIYYMMIPLLIYQMKSKKMEEVSVYE